MTDTARDRLSAVRNETAGQGNFRYFVREVVGVFPDEQSLERAVDDLMLHGIARREISVLGPLQPVLSRVRQLEDDLSAPLEGFVSSDSRTLFEAGAVGLPIYIVGLGSYAAVIASGGTLAFALSALLLAGAAGGGLGGVLAYAIKHRHRTSVERQLAAGGLLLWVAVRDEAQETRALEVFRKVGAGDVHLHEIERTWGAKQVPFHDVQPDPFLENEHRDVGA